MIVGIVAVALNLRSGVTSLGAVLGEMTRYWQFSGVVAGIVTALPVLTFAVVGSTASVVARRFGAERIVAAAMALSATGLILRALAGSVVVFLAASVLALAGAAIGNVLLPPLVKRYFPTRIGTMTALYSTALALGMTGGAGLTVPIEHAFGGDWRLGLGVWGGLALLAAPPWFALVGTRECVGLPGQPKTLTGVHRSGTARALTLFFGCQSLNAYVVFGWLPTILADAGLDARDAGLPLALSSAMSIPMSLLVPGLATRKVSQYGLVVVTTALYAGGYLGLLIAPASAPLVWAVLLGAGNGALPLAVTMIGLRSGGAEMTTALSTLVQSGGYLLAAAGPLLVGVLHQNTSGWRIPLLVLFAGLAVQLLSGLRAAAPRPVEDELVPAGRHSAETLAGWHRGLAVGLAGLVLLLGGAGVWLAAGRGGPVAPAPALAAPLPPTNALTIPGPERPDLASAPSAPSHRAPAAALPMFGRPPVTGGATATPQPTTAPPRTGNTTRDRVPTGERERGTGLVGQVLGGAMAQLSLR